MMTQSVVIQHPSFTTDARGNQIKNWTVSTTESALVWITQRANGSSTELNDTQSLREAEDSEWIMFTKHDLNVNIKDRVKYGNLTFEVRGVPHTAQKPSGPHHLQVALSLLEG